MLFSPQGNQMYLKIQNKKRSHKAGNKSLIFSVSPPPHPPFWLLFAGAGCDAVPGRGTWQFVRGPALRLRAAAVSSIVKCLIPRRAERPGHLGSVLMLAKLSCLIISGAAGVGVRRFVSCICQACFLWKLSASKAAVTWPTWLLPIPEMLSPSLLQGCYRGPMLWDAAFVLMQGEDGVATLAFLFLPRLHARSAAGHQGGSHHHPAILH